MRLTFSNWFGEIWASDAKTVQVSVKISVFCVFLNFFRNFNPILKFSYDLWWKKSCNIKETSAYDWHFKINLNGFGALTQKQCKEQFRCPPWGTALVNCVHMQKRITTIMKMLSFITVRVLGVDPSEFLDVHHGNSHKQNCVESYSINGKYFLKKIKK